jgi:hypothetical protein
MWEEKILFTGRNILGEMKMTEPLLCLVVALFTLVTTPTFAQESAMKVEETKPKTNETPGEDIDETITNSLLRAESGSKSKWSIASTINYNGGSIEKPLDEERPNIANATGTSTESLLEGQISAKYNITPSQSVLAGVGVRWFAPLEAHPKGIEGDRMDADNPYAIYQYLYKWSGIQSVLQVQQIYYTNVDRLAEGYVTSFNVNQDNMYQVPNTKLSIGASVWAQIAYYNKTGPLGTPGEEGFLADMRDDQSDYSIGLEPTIEYAFTESISFRAVSSLWNFEHLRSQPRFNTYRWDKVSQSIGLGISVTRDIFLYPNVQFLPDDLSPSRTNVALNANINVF